MVREGSSGAREASKCRGKKVSTKKTIASTREGNFKMQARKGDDSTDKDGKGRRKFSLHCLIAEF